MILLGLEILASSYIISEVVHRRKHKAKKIRSIKKIDNSLQTKLNNINSIKPHYILDAKTKLQLSILFTVLAPITYFYRALSLTLLLGLSIVSIPIIRQAQNELLEKKNINYSTLNALVSIITMAMGKYFFVGLNALLHYLGDTILLDTKYTIAKSQCTSKNTPSNFEIEAITIDQSPFHYEKNADKGSRLLLLLTILGIPILGKESAANILNIYPNNEIRAFPALHLSYFLKSAIKENIFINNIDKVNLLAKVDIVIFSKYETDNMFYIKDISQKLKTISHIDEVFILNSNNTSIESIIDKIQTYQNNGHIVAWVGSHIETSLISEYADITITNQDKQAELADILLLKNSWANLPYLFKNAALLKKYITQSFLICTGYGMTNATGTIIWRFSITTGLSLDAIQWLIALKHIDYAKQTLQWHKE